MPRLSQVSLTCMGSITCAYLTLENCDGRLRRMYFGSNAACAYKVTCILEKDA